MVSAAAPVPSVRLISVGDELLCGRTIDTNGPEVQRELGSRGIPVAAAAVVPDEARAIAEALESVPSGALAIMTGGLGPTDDDLTREAVAVWAEAPLRIDPEVDSSLSRRCRVRGRPYGEGMKRQARVPEGMTALLNPVGSAPCLYGRLRGRDLILLPGVPSEMRALLPSVLDLLVADRILPASPPTLRLRTARLFESIVADLCAPIREARPALRWSWWLSRWGVDVQVGAPAGADPREIAEFEAAAAELRGVLGNHVFAEDGSDLPAVVLDLLVDRGRTVAVAESCSGGMLGAALTDVPGASRVFRGGILAYANEVKQSRLGVSAGILERDGAVSGACAEAMAAGCREAIGSDYALSITGIAGPGGATPGKPVGTHWVGLATPDATTAAMIHLPAGRGRNRELAVALALDTLRVHLQETDHRERARPDAGGRS